MPYKNENDPRRKQSKMDHYYRLRRAAIAAYGGQCACCATTEYDFLQLDHVANDGAEHRKRLKDKGSFAVYRELAKHEYPEGKMQVLCANCHFVKTKALICPHKR